MTLTPLHTRHALGGTAFALFWIAADQISKWAIMEHVLRTEDGSFRSIELLPFFNLVMVWNKGISFGMFSNSGAALALTAVALCAAAVLWVWMARTRCLRTAFALSLIVGGAIGNVIDRIRFGAVVDFLDFYVGAYHWPAFNVADSCISIGAAVMIWVTFTTEDTKETP